MPAGSLPPAATTSPSPATGAHAMTIKSTALAFAAEHDVVVFPTDSDKRPVLTGGTNHSGTPARLAWKGLTAAQAADLPYWGNDDCVGYGVRLENVVVVDIDQPNRRAEALAELGLTGCTTFEVDTPRPGTHLYYRGEQRCKNFDGGEIKTGRGAYVVGPGSGHANGGTYAVVDAAASWASIPASYLHPGGGSGDPSANGSRSGGGGSGMVIQAPEQMAKLNAALAAMKGDVEHFDGITLAWRSGQWEGPCPRCRTGDDRFRLLIKGDKVLAKCRQCPPSSEHLYGWLRRRHHDIALGYTLPEDDVVAVSCTRVRGYVPCPWRSLGTLGVLPDGPPPPIVPAVVDAGGATLLAEGVYVDIHGDSGSGKTWAGIALAFQTNSHVVWLAYEKYHDTVDRFRETVTAADRERIRVFDAAVLDDATLARIAAVVRGRPALVVIDAVSASGCPISGDNIEPWKKRVVVPWCGPRATVIQLDHRVRKPKGEGGPRAPGAAGSVTKTAAVNASYEFTAGTVGDNGDLLDFKLASVKMNRRTVGTRKMIGKFRDGRPVVKVAKRKKPLTEAAAFTLVASGMLSQRAGAKACGASESTFRRRYKAGAPSTH